MCGLMDEHEDRYFQAVPTEHCYTIIPKSFKNASRYRDNKTPTTILSKLFYVKVKSSQVSFGDKRKLNCHTQFIQYPYQVMPLDIYEY